jgi:hypothetical protein
MAASENNDHPMILLLLQKTWHELSIYHKKEALETIQDSNKDDLDFVKRMEQLCISQPLHEITNNHCAPIIPGYSNKAQRKIKTNKIQNIENIENIEKTEISTDIGKDNKSPRK